MSYQKHTWECGESITADKLNHMENGIASAGGGGGGSSYTEVTYSELKAMRDNGELTVGGLYRITDYICTSTYENTQVEDHPFDIIVIADSESSLNENALAAIKDGDTYYNNPSTGTDAVLSAWEIKYCIDNDLSRFDWVDPDNGHGVIHYMKDDKGNECYYDFKQIKFAREASDDGGGGDDPDPPKSGETKAKEDTKASGDFEIAYYFTFSGISGGSDGGDDGGGRNTKAQGDETFTIVDNSIRSSSFTFDNRIGRMFSMYEGEDDGGDDGGGDIILSSMAKRIKDIRGNGSENPAVRLALNDIVFIGDGCYSNTFGDWCYSNTFGDYCYSNTFGDWCYSNTFGDDCYSNTFGDECYSNTFGDGCYSNTFGDDCYSNTFGDECIWIIFRNAAAVDGDHLLQHYNVLAGIQGSSNSPLTLTTEINRQYTTYVGYNSSGTLKYYNPMDAAA